MKLRQLWTDMIVWNALAWLSLLSRDHRSTYQALSPRSLVSWLALLAMHQYSIESESQVRASRLLRTDGRTEYCHLISTLWVGGFETARP